MSALYADRHRAESFGADAASYDRVRPSYPRELVDELLVGKPVSVLDVGCGTGIAAVLFNERGCRVLGVEPDERMARFSRGKGLDVEIAKFESWQARGRSFDLLVCAQAWHWIDPVVGAVKAAETLNANGRLGVFWNFGAPPADIKRAFNAIYMRLAPDIERHSILLGNTDHRLDVVTAALDQSARFTPSELHTWRWSRRYTTAQWREHLLTHSDHKALPAADQEALLGGIGEVLDNRDGAVEIGYETHLISAYTLP